MVYESPDLRMFSRLVSDLRATEGRAYTKSDTPVHTAIYCPTAEVDALWP